MNKKITITGVIKIKKVTKPTNAKMFKNIKEGSILLIKHIIGKSYPISAYNTATYEITLKEETICITATALQNRLKNFEISEV